MTLELHRPGSSPRSTMYAERLVPVLQFPHLLSEACGTVGGLWEQSAGSSLLPFAPATCLKSDRKRGWREGGSDCSTSTAVCGVRPQGPSLLPPLPLSTA